MKIQHNIFGGLWRLSPRISQDALLILAHQIIIQRCDENSYPTNTAYIYLEDPSPKLCHRPAGPAAYRKCDVLNTAKTCQSFVPIHIIKTFDLRTGTECHTRSVQDDSLSHG